MTGEPKSEITQDHRGFTIDVHRLSSYLLGKRFDGPYCYTITDRDGAIKELGGGFETGDGALECAVESIENHQRKDG